MTIKRILQKLSESRDLLSLGSEDFSQAAEDMKRGGTLKATTRKGTEVEFSFKDGDFYVSWGDTSNKVEAMAVQSGRVFFPGGTFITMSDRRALSKLTSIRREMKA